MTPQKIRRELSAMKFTTEHANTAKANAISHLLTYERSLQTADSTDLGALAAFVEYVVWLLDHVRTIDDKQITPSQRDLLDKAWAWCLKSYNEQKVI